MRDSTLLNITNFYLFFVTLSGGVLLYFHLSFPKIQTKSEWVLLILFTFTIFLLNIYLIRLPQSENYLSMDSSIYLASIFIFGLEFTLFILLASSILFLIYENRLPFWKHLSNFMIYSVLITGSYYTLIFTGGELGFFSSSNVLSYVLALVVYYIINLLLMGTYFFLASNVRPLTLVKDFLESSPHYLVALVLALILLLILESHPIFGLLLFNSVIILVSLAFKKYHVLYKEVSNDKIYREQILNSLPIGIMTINNSTSDYYLNTSASRLLNMDSDAVKSLISSKNLPQSNQHFWELIASNQKMHNIKTSFISVESHHQLLVSKAELMDQKEELIGEIHYFMDITKIEELEKRILQSQKLALLGEVSARAAHEIRNPLTVIQGFLTLMMRSITKEEREKYHFSLLLKELERINLIIEEMLLIAKPDTPSLEETYIEDIIHEVIQLHDQNSSTKEIQFKINLDRVPILLDTKQMTQVIYNLIRNSNDSIDNKGTISFYSKLQNNSYQLFISDTGFGIPENFQNSIFNPFLTTKDSGTGLGLTIVQRIIQNHQGSIELYSSSASGTTFLITLPITNTN